MSTAEFQKKVLSYSHLPTVFLLQLSKVADRLPEEKRDEIVAELDKSAEKELTILTEGYQLIADAEKGLRGKVESFEHEQELGDAERILSQSSNTVL